MRQLLDLTLQGAVCVNNFDMFEQTLAHGKKLGFKLAVTYDAILVALRLSELQTEKEDFRILLKMCTENVIVVPKLSAAEIKKVDPENPFGKHNFKNRTEKVLLEHIEDQAEEEIDIESIALFG